MVTKSIHSAACEYINVIKDEFALGQANVKVISETEFLGRKISFAAFAIARPIGCALAILANLCFILPGACASALLSKMTKIDSKSDYNDVIFKALENGLVNYPVALVMHPAGCLYQIIKDLIGK